MSITYPLALPSTGIRSIVLRANDVIGAGTSPFTLTTQVQQHQGQAWEADIELPPMHREDAEQWITFLLKLKGRYGTFLLRDTVSGTPRGSWAGTPLVLGAHAAGASSVMLDGLSDGATIKAGDWVQFGTGLTSRLHKVLSDAGPVGSPPAAEIDIWPNLRESLADDAAIVTSNAVGLFRLATNQRSWDIGLAEIYGLRFTAVEAL